MRTGWLAGTMSIASSDPLDQQGVHKGPEKAGHLPGVTGQLGIHVWRDQESEREHREHRGGAAPDPR